MEYWFMSEQWLNRIESSEIGRYMCECIGVYVYAYIFFTYEYIKKQWKIPKSVGEKKFNKCQYSYHYNIEYYSVKLDFLTPCKTKI